MAESISDLKLKWDQRYREDHRAPTPVQVLTENLHLLPTGGRALDLACGRGANALLLAERGLAVQAWDLSAVAIAQLRRQTASRKLAVSADVRDVLAQPPTAESFDVIIVSFFLDRTLAPLLSRALRPGGLIYYQTFARSAVSDLGPGTSAYRLGDNELLSLFSDLIIRVYREEGRAGNTRQGTRDVAMLVAEKASTPTS